MQKNLQKKSFKKPNSELEPGFSTGIILKKKELVDITLKRGKFLVKKGLLTEENLESILGQDLSNIRFLTTQTNNAVYVQHTEGPRGEYLLSQAYEDLKSTVTLPKVLVSGEYSSTYLPGHKFFLFEYLRDYQHIEALLADQSIPSRQKKSLINKVAKTAATIVNQGYLFADSLTHFLAKKTEKGWDVRLTNVDLRSHKDLTKFPDPLKKREDIYRRGQNLASRAVNGHNYGPYLIQQYQRFLNSELRKK